ncbi:MAG: metal-dependent hydrolase [Candidatus Aenigmarchaeota archaeon]|nr:metal-dependent hydrolase [Candidatus Aenigmarchaeota archaeon]
MPFAVTHILFPIIVLDELKKHWSALKRRLTMHTLLVAGVAGLLPDADILVELVFAAGGATLDIHRLYTHTFVIPLVIAGVALAFKGRRRWLLLAAAFGWATHVTLDLLVGGEVSHFFPFAGPAEIGLLVNASMPLEMRTAILAGLDAAVFLVWLWHEEKYKKLKDFF